jgi:hypothetical protein
MNANGDMRWRYRLKESEIEAILWTGHNKHEMMEFLGENRDGSVKPGLGRVLVVNLNTPLRPLWAELPPGAYLLRTRAGWGIQTRASFELDYERMVGAGAR